MDWGACIDIGGTKVSVSLHPGDTSTQLQARRSEPTAKTGPPFALAEQIVRMVHEAAAEIGIDEGSVRRAGVASCGPFVLRDGLIELAAPNICGGLAGAARGLPNDWTSAPIEEPLRRRFVDLRIENDGIAALEAERRWGALQQREHCAYVTWSTGVGFGLCVDGRPLRGKHGNAGHAGHTFVVDDDQALCGCGNRGDLESLVAGSAIHQRYGIPAAQLFGQAAAGDAESLGRVDELCRIMGRALYNVIATLDLERIAMGGSVFLHNQELLLPRVQAHIRGKLPALTQGCDIVAAALGERVGDYAALALLSN